MYAAAPLGFLKPTKYVLKAIKFLVFILGLLGMNLAWHESLFIEHCIIPAA